MSVKASALALGKLIELLPIQQLIQPLIERMARRRSQFCVRYPELFLALSVFPCAHRHKNILRSVCFHPKNNLRVAF
jgi:hypothetical protein